MLLGEIDMDRKYKIRIHGTEFNLEQTKDGIKIQDYLFNPEVMFNGKYYRVFINGNELKIEYKDNAILLDGKEIDFSFTSAPQLQSKKGQGNKKGATIKAAIPGKIIEIKVKLGDHVKDQQCLLILESMKMRNEILSPVEGIIEKIAVSIGEQVSSNQLLIKIKSQLSD
ncbi:MAG: acetyl-CoA carboxylase biotin carboxyl carrier protein subunit [Asgard group archaeon]|nr:acetyl-CoA carboxylase biotin carboxyl carrier protein subunit [Asgard group archaeon]